MNVGTHPVLTTLEMPREWIVHVIDVLGDDTRRLDGVTLMAAIDRQRRNEKIRSYLQREL